MAFAPKEALEGDFISTSRDAYLTAHNISAYSLVALARKAAPLMKDALSLTAFEYGIAVSAFFWVYGPLQLVVGWLCDRFSVYRLLAWGVGLWAVATLLSGFVAGFVSLVVLRTLLGIGGSLAFPASSKIIAEQVSPESRGMWSAWRSVKGSWMMVKLTSVMRAPSRALLMRRDVTPPGTTEHLRSTGEARAKR